MTVRPEAGMTVRLRPVASTLVTGEGYDNAEEVREGGDHIIGAISGRLLLSCNNNNDYQCCPMPHLESTPRN